MDSIERLSSLLRKFPGIGIRQSRRLAYFLLQTNNSFREELAEEIIMVGNSMNQCSECFRFFTRKEKNTVCELCRNLQTDKTMLLVVEKDIDVENVMKSHAYSGKYFVLGGLIPIIDKKNTSLVRLKEFINRLQNDSFVKEIIFALNANPEGDNTAIALSGEIQKIIPHYNGKITRLGRGLSTGTELEYSDSDTIKEALGNRK